MKCSICGCENDSSVTVCSQCGAALNSPVVTAFCCHCGKQIRPTAKYCVYCGSKQEELPVQPEPSAEAEVPAVEPATEIAASIPAETPVESVEQPAEPNVQPAYEAVEEPTAEPCWYTPAAPAAQFSPPAHRLPTHRGFWKMFLLGILTGMIYPMVILSRISEEINMVASRHDGKRTMQLMWVPFVGALTLGIYFFVWIHKLCGRIGRELRRRQVGYRFGAGSFWLWNFLWGILGGLVTSVAVTVLYQQSNLNTIYYVVGAAGAIVSSLGPFIFTHKLMRATNLMNADYNEKG